MKERNRKIDPKMTVKKEDRLKKIIQAIEKIESVLGRKDSEMWDDIQLVLQDKIDEKERYLSNFKEMDDRSIAIMLAEWNELKTFFDFFDTIDKSLVNFYKLKSEAELDISERKKDQPDS